MALQTLLAVAPDRRGEFQSLLQENYSLIASQDKASVTKLLTALSHSCIEVRETRVLRVEARGRKASLKQDMSTN